MTELAPVAPHKPGPPRKLTLPLLREAVRLYYRAAPGMGLSWEQVAGVLGTSERTLRRRRRDPEWTRLLHEEGMGLLGEAGVVALTRLLHDARTRPDPTGTRAAEALARLVHPQCIQLAGALTVQAAGGRPDYTALSNEELQLLGRLIAKASAGSDQLALEAGAEGEEGATDE